jgi:general secretion pathway protein D
VTDFIRHSLSRCLPHTSRIALASTLALISACAMLPQQQGSNAAVVPAPAQTVQAAASASAPPVPETTTTRSDNGISRPGRVIPLEPSVEQAPGGQPPQDNVVELNYEQQDMRFVIQELGDLLGISMVIDPTIDYKVSLRTSATNPLRYEDIWPVLRLLARNAGVSIQQAGSVWEFNRDPSNLPVAVLLPGAVGSVNASEVLQVTPLTYISVETLEPILVPMLQPAGTLIRMGAPNLVGITGSPEQLARVNALLAVLDDDPFLNQGIRLYQLMNSPAAEVAEEMNGVLKLIEGEQGSYQVLGLDRINSVLVIGPAARGFAEVDRWINILDAASQEQVEQLFVYKVKNLDAVAMAETLNNVYGEEDEDEAARTAREAGALQPQVFQLAPVLDAASAAAANDQVASANISVSIVADENTNSLLVRATPREYRQLLTTISALDTVPLQVLINAVIGQVTLTEGNQFGIDWTRVSSNAASGPGRLSSRFLPDGILDAGRLATQGSGLVLTKTFMDGAAVIDATLNAIAQDNEVRLLARPTLLAANNQEGEFVVGQAVPVNNGTTTSGNGFATENITYRDVGIVLKITPQINEDGYINLEIEQSLSSVEESNTTGVAGNPTFVNQEITTTVVVSDQTTITLGGLIQDEDADVQNGIPLLQNIPVLGRAFSYSNIKSSRRELFIILRPQIIYGDQRDAATMAAMREGFTEVGKLLDAAGL